MPLYHFAALKDGNDIFLKKQPITVLHKIKG